jgi:hypothetical protein
MICPVEIAHEVSAFRAVRMGDHAEHRQHAYRVRFNENPQYPQILEIIEKVHARRLPVASDRTHPA